MQQLVPETCLRRMGSRGRGTVQGEEKGRLLVRTWLDKTGTRTLSEETGSKLKRKEIYLLLM